MSETHQEARDQKLAAFHVLVNQYEGPLLRYAARILRDPDAAQDAVQDAFIKLLRRWHDELKPSPQVSAWLYRVVHNCAVDYLRRQARWHSLVRGEAERTPATVPPDRGEGFRISESAEQAAWALRTLSEREQQLVILKVYEEKSYREIGEITGLSVGNVGYILHHAMKKLAAELKKAKAI